MYLNWGALAAHPSKLNNPPVNFPKHIMILNLFSKSKATTAWSYYIILEKTCMFFLKEEKVLIKRQKGNLLEAVDNMF